MIADEFSSIKMSSSNFFRSFQRKKRISTASKRAEEEVRNMLTQKHCAKMNSALERKVSALSKNECRLFAEWFLSREALLGRNSANVTSSEYSIQHVIDDFVAAGVYTYRGDAFDFLKSIDTDRTGTISLKKLCKSIPNISDNDHVSTLRRFLAGLADKETSSPQLSPAKSRLERSMSVSELDFGGAASSPTSGYNRGQSSAPALIARSVSMGTPVSAHNYPPPLPRLRSVKPPHTRTRHTLNSISSAALRSAALSLPPSS